ncbi:MAG: lipoate--protein ligase family protein [Elusimicrobiales bacterium]
MRGIVVDTPSFDVYEQMSCDEIMCETMPAECILRFYRWKDNGITFGFSQRYSKVLSTLAEDKKNYKMTRRPTGGGIVIHEDDLTFSLIFYSPGEFNPEKTYNMLHSAIYHEYAKNGFLLKIAASKKPSYEINEPVMECFKKPVNMDLMVEEKKVLGGALRRFSDYMLYQASLQFENARSSSLHTKLITEAFENLFQVRFEKYELRDEYIKRIEEKANEKYLSDKWIKRI